MICVGVDGSGFVYQTVETFPACSEFALVGVSHLERLTYWADVAILFDPDGTFLYEFMAATLMAFIAAFTVRQVARVILNR